MRGNGWTRCEAAPPPLFFGSNHRIPEAKTGFTRVLSDSEEAKRENLYIYSTLKAAA